MTTDKRELGSMDIISGPSLHSVITSLSVALPPPDGCGVSGTPFGFPVFFYIPREGCHTGDEPNTLSVVITGADNFEYDYCNYVLIGYFKKFSRIFLCSFFKLPTLGESLDSLDSVGWLTFRADYNVHTRKGKMTIEYSDKNPYHITRSIKRYD